METKGNNMGTIVIYLFGNGRQLNYHVCKSTEHAHLFLGPFCELHCMWTSNLFLYFIWYTNKLNSILVIVIRYFDGIVPCILKSQIKSICFISTIFFQSNWLHNFFVFPTVFLPNQKIPCYKTTKKLTTKHSLSLSGNRFFCH